jgi:PAS domain-containing protein
MEEKLLKIIGEEAAGEAIELLVREMPIGVLLTNDKLEVLYTNQNIEQFLKDTPISEKLVLGNQLHCENVADDALCGSTAKCDSCLIRNNALNALQQDRIICNVKVHFRHLRKNGLYSSWLDLTFIPQKSNGEKRLWIFLINTTERVQEKLVREMQKFLEI